MLQVVFLTSKGALVEISGCRLVRISGLVVSVWPDGPFIFALVPAVGQLFEAGSDIFEVTICRDDTGHTL